MAKVQQEKVSVQLQEEQPLEDRKWLCTSCKFILAHINKEKTKIRMKAKDFFLTVEGGKIIHPCRRCGEFNELVDTDYLMWKSQQKLLHNFLANRVLFEEFLKRRDGFMEFLMSKNEKPKKTLKKKTNK